ncbi:SpoIID/LytB domain-containing protein [bacterium]|nr:SpoIID/LytB domain-containing protein [bacterium]
MNNLKLLIPALSLLIVVGCGIKPPPSDRILDGGPKIKIGLHQGTDTIRFTLSDNAAIVNKNSTFIVRRQLHGTWQAKVLHVNPGKTVWFLVAASKSSAAEARKEVRALRRRGFETFIYPAGQKLKITDRLIKENANYRVCLKQSFSTKLAAEQYKNVLAKKLDTFIIKHALIPPGGSIRLLHEESGQEFASTEPIIIKGDRITLHDIPVGVGFHWEHKEDRSYPEDIILQVGTDGKLVVMNHLYMEHYLKGVVPSEMPSGFPLEALKAQAIAARSETLAKLGKAHSSDPYDLCSDVHCQVYSGLTRRDANTDRAVDITQGKILMDGEEILDAVYSSVCGGHGESANHAWGGEGRSYLKGSFDGSGRLQRYGKLTLKSTARRWIDATPDAYCNSKRRPDIASLEYTRKYFRWELNIPQDEIRTQLERHMGRSVGPIIKLEPITRGDSGRITKLRVEGRTGSYIIHGELTIRRALKRTTLWSSCFYVQTKRGEHIPSQFILKGAGFGHGVGMCQTGAAGMGLKGYNYKKILKHYYKGCQIRQIY